MSVLTSSDKYLYESISPQQAILNFRRSTSTYRELVLTRDPLIFHTFDPDLYDGQDATYKVFYDAARPKSYNGSIRRVYGSFVAPVSGSDGVVFNGTSALRQNLNLAAGPGGDGNTTASSYINILRQEVGFTLECWINKTATGSYSEVMWIGGDNDQDRGAKIRMDGDGTWVAFRMQSTVPTVHEVFVGSLTLANSAWHHIAATWDGTDMKLYINGVLGGTTTPPGGTSVNWPSGTSTSETDNTAAMLHLGSWIYDGSALGFNGKIDGAAVYAYPLTLGEVFGNRISGSVASNRNTYVPAEGFDYEVAEFPPFVVANDYIEGRIVKTTTASSGGYSAWKDSDNNSVASEFESLSLTVRQVDEISGRRRIENVTLVYDGFADYMIQFGLGYDPQFTSTGGKFLKFAVYNGYDVNASVFSTEGGDLTPTSVDGYYEFEWEPRRFYRFELVNTATGVALYIDNVLVDAYTCAQNGFNTGVSFVTNDWQRYDDPLVEHDWLVVRGISGGTEYSLKLVSALLNSFDWYETATRDSVRIAGYMIRHRSHVPSGSQHNDSTTYTYTLDDSLFAVRPTLANSPSVSWLPVRNSLGV